MPEKPLKKFDVIVSTGGQTKTWVVEARTGVAENLGNGMLKIGDFTCREGALIAIMPHTPAAE